MPAGNASGRRHGTTRRPQQKFAEYPHCRNIPIVYPSSFPLRPFRPPCVLHFNPARWAGLWDSCAFGTFQMAAFQAPMRFPGLRCGFQGPMRFPGPRCGFRGPMRFPGPALQSVGDRWAIRCGTSPEFRLHRPSHPARADGAEYPNCLSPFFSLATFQAAICGAFQPSPVGWAMEFVCLRHFPDGGKSKLSAPFFSLATFQAALCFANQPSPVGWAMEFVCLRHFPDGRKSKLFVPIFLWVYGVWSLGILGRGRRRWLIP